MQAYRKTYTDNERQGVPSKLMSKAGDLLNEAEFDDQDMDLLDRKMGKLGHKKGQFAGKREYSKPTRLGHNDFPHQILNWNSFTGAVEEMLRFLDKEVTDAEPYPDETNYLPAVKGIKSHLMQLQPILDSIHNELISGTNQER